MYFRDANHCYQLAGRGYPDSFDIIYTKADGTFGEKKGCKRRPSPQVNKDSKSITSIQMQNKQAGKWYLWHPQSGNFEIHAVGIIAFNGQYIDHRF